MLRRADSRSPSHSRVIAWLMALAIIAVMARDVSAQRAGSIDTISPPAARVGEPVTIKGRGFGAFNVRVTVGGVPAALVSANGSEVTFRVPDGVSAGMTQVVAANPGGQSDSIGFRMLEGVLLVGAASASAVSATVDMPPVRMTPGNILDGTFMTRLDVRLRPGATIAQVNDALTRVEGGIVTMVTGQPTITIAIPRPATVAVLAAVADTLNSLPGISRASIAHEAQTKRLPAGSTGSGFTELFHLIPEGFPAAWNASFLATDGCGSRKVKVVVADKFDTESYLGFFFEIPSASFHLLVPPVVTDTHGDEVTTTLAAQFAPPNPTGAVPFPECLDIDAIAVDGFTGVQQIILLSQTFPAGKFLLNYSMGYPDELKCIQNGCSLLDLRVDTGGLAVDRAYDAADWKHFTSRFWGNFLLSVAGGNERAKAGTIIYPGLGVAAFDSALSVATLPDPSFAFVQDGSQWDPQVQPGAGGFASMAATPPEKSALDQYAQSYGSSASVVAENVLMVGAASAGSVPESLVARPYSDRDPDVFAVGENIYTLSSGFTEGGTSLATPQVTGLAAYLWLLSSGAHAKNAAFPDLSQLDPSVTRQAILANARLGLGVNVIDAYSSALSLDAATDVSPSTAPVRLALLDLDGNGAFLEDDLEGFVSGYVDSATGNPVEPQDATYSRFDLNGDGYTGGSRTARFDLDRVGSTQFGAAQYSSQVLQNIGGDVAFNENALTDLQILCYYAYSALYTGDTTVREQLLRGHCDLVVNPASVTLRPGQHQQFTASVPSGDAVTWTATGGTIDTTTGFYTAGGAAGTFKVTAISVADPSLKGEAQVTIIGSPGHFGVESQFSGNVIAETLGASGTVLANNLVGSSNGSPSSINVTTNPDPIEIITFVSIFDSNNQLQSGQVDFGSVHLNAQGTGPITREGDPTFNDSSGTFSAQVVCSASVHDAQFAGSTVRVPLVAVTRYHVSFYIETVPAGGLTLTLAGSLSQTGAGNGSAFGDPGDISVSSTSGGQRQPDINISLGIRDNVVPISQTIRLAPPGDFSVDVNLSRNCSGTDTAAATLSLNYLIQ